ncbi:MAG TPA: hypothetical protein VFU88_19370 [Ktedonobacterales bacterium]|nr:hypothetical protein [Ktedonobacterales bacterium]
MDVRLERLTTPRLRWRWLAAAVVAWALMVWVMLSMILPPLGNVALKGVAIIVLTLIWLPCFFIFLISILGLDEHESPSRTPITNQPQRGEQTLPASDRPAHAS